VLGHVPLEPLPKVFEHGGPPGQDDVSVEAAAAIDGALDDRLVHHFGEGLIDGRGEER
jgi:hypothetical protein